MSSSIVGAGNAFEEMVMAIEFEVKQEGASGVVVVGESLDVEETGEALCNAVEGLLEKGTTSIVVDMQNVQILNSYGIGRLCYCYQTVKEKNGVFEVTNIPQVYVRLFEILRIDDLFSGEPLKLEDDPEPVAPG